jgi:hypothetical protein
VKGKKRRFTVFIGAGNASGFIPVFARDQETGIPYGWEDEKGLASFVADVDAVSAAMTAFSLVKERFKGEEWNTNYSVECRKILENLAKVYFAPIHPDKGDRQWRIDEAMRKLKRLQQSQMPRKTQKKGESQRTR